ncbi:MAG TPA: alanine racemase [Burkholderiales bacterium]|nr:alanine racemase [Burkholderiales bacterium]
MSLETLETPALLLDAAIMERNIARLRERLKTLGVPLRPHVKTAKCHEVAKRALDGQPGGITVSTLAEAEYFAARGVRDILYAVGIAPNKVKHIQDLRRRDVDVTVVLDNAEQAAFIGDLPALIEIDCDGHRSGVRPDSASLIELGSKVKNLRGVMTHAGASYNCRTTDAIVEMAEQERLSVVSAAAKLGLKRPVVSVGSTPTAHFARRLEGVTEVRAGVYMFFDLVMAGISVCGTQDIALSVLATVIGHQPEKGWAITDAGWMAMSRDRGTASQPLDQGYGLVCDADGRALADVIVKDANQEHGILAHRSGDAARMPALPVGTLVRILPNHACATAAQHGAYHVVRGSREIEARWDRMGGW